MLWPKSDHRSTLRDPSESSDRCPTRQSSLKPTSVRSVLRWTRIINVPYGETKKKQTNKQNILFRYVAAHRLSLTHFSPFYLDQLTKIKEKTTLVDVSSDLINLTGIQCTYLIWLLTLLILSRGWTLKRNKFLAHSAGKTNTTKTFWNLFFFRLVMACELCFHRTHAVPSNSSSSSIISMAILWLFLFQKKIDYKNAFTKKIKKWNQIVSALQLFYCIIILTQLVQFYK